MSPVIRLYVRLLAIRLGTQCATTHTCFTYTCVYIARQGTPIMLAVFIQRQLGQRTSILGGRKFTKRAVRRLVMDGYRTSSAALGLAPPVSSRAPWRPSNAAHAFTRSTCRAKAMKADLQAMHEHTRARTCPACRKNNHMPPHNGMEYTAYLGGDHTVCDKVRHVCSPDGVVAALGSALRLAKAAALLQVCGRKVNTSTLSANIMITGTVQVNCHVAVGRHA